MSTLIGHVSSTACLLTEPRQADSAPGTANQQGLHILMMDNTSSGTTTSCPHGHRQPARGRQTQSSIPGPRPVGTPVWSSGSVLSDRNPWPLLLPFAHGGQCGPISAHR